MKECCFFILVGEFPTKEECEKMGGCSKCSFYLPEPPKEET